MKAKRPETRKNHSQQKNAGGDPTADPEKLEITARSTQNHSKQKTQGAQTKRHIIEIIFLSIYTMSTAKHKNCNTDGPDICTDCLKAVKDFKYAAAVALLDSNKPKRTDTKAILTKKLEDVIEATGALIDNAQYEKENDALTICIKKASRGGGTNCPLITGLLRASPGVNRR